MATGNSGSALRAVTTKSSKADEIALLREMVKLAGQGSYLASFFSEDAVRWLEQQITDDFACDLYDAYKSTDSEASKLRGKLAQVEADADDFEEQAAQTIKAREAETARLRAEFDSYRKACEEGMAHDAQIIYRLQDEESALRAQVQALQAEQQRLKALLWDQSEEIRRLSPQPTLVAADTLIYDDDGDN